MGIKAIKAVEPEANHGILEVDLSEWAGEGAVVRFRQPKAADIFPDGTALKALQVSYPEMNQGYWSIFPLLLSAMWQISMTPARLLQSVRLPT